MAKEVKEKTRSVELKAIDAMRDEISSSGLTLSDAQLAVIIRLVKACK